MRFKRPRLRLGIRGLAIAIAAVAVLLWAGLVFWSPTRRMAAQLRTDQPLYARKEAAASLGRGIPFWEVDRALDLLLNALDDPSPVVREYAGVSLSELGPRSRPAVPKLVGLLTDEHRGVRFSAARCLGFIGVDPGQKDEVVKALERALNDPEPANRVAVAETLLSLGGSEKAAGVLVAAKLGDKYPGDWADTIIRKATEQRPFLAALAAEMHGKDRQRREKAYQALIAKAPPETVQLALGSAMADKDDEVRRWAASHYEKPKAESEITP